MARVFPFRTFLYRVPEGCGPEEQFQGILCRMAWRKNEAVTTDGWVLYEAPEVMWEGCLRPLCRRDFYTGMDFLEAISEAEEDFEEYKRQHGGVELEGHRVFADRNSVPEFIYYHLLNMAADRVLVVGYW